MRSGYSFTAIVLCISIVVAPGCQKKASDTVVKSCTITSKAMMDTTTGSTSECIDQFDKGASCGWGTSSDTPCTRTNLVAGCKTADEIHWFYNKENGSATPQSVRLWCTKGTTIMPDGRTADTRSATDVASNDLDTHLKADGPKARSHLTMATSLAAKLPTPTGKVDLGGLKGDALLVHREDLADPEHPKAIPYRLKRTDQLAACSRLLNGRKQSADAPYELTYCAKDPFLLVVSVTDYTPATATGSTISGQTKTTFVKRGKMSGDVFVFRLEDGKYVGSVPFAIENDAADIAPEKLTADLHEKFASALSGKLRSTAPSVSVIIELAK